MVYLHTIIQLLDNCAIVSRTRTTITTTTTTKHGQPNDSLCPTHFVLSRVIDIDVGHSMSLVSRHKCTFRFTQVLLTALKKCFEANKHSTRIASRNPVPWQPECSDSRVCLVFVYMLWSSDGGSGSSWLLFDADLIATVVVAMCATPSLLTSFFGFVAVSW